jgi:hypothetical protein
VAKGARALTNAAGAGCLVTNIGRISYGTFVVAWGFGAAARTSACSRRFLYFARLAGRQV